MGLAQELRRNGRYEEALAIYRAAAEAGRGQGQRQALWGLAQTHLDLGQFTEAAEALQALLEREPEPGTARRARYLLGLALARIGRNAAANAAFRAYIEDGGPALHYARMEMAALLAAEGEHGEAAAELERALTADLPLSPRLSALLSLGRAYAAIDDIDRAFVAFQQLAEGAKSAADKATALWEMAALYRRRGDEASRRHSLLRIVREQPGQSLALAALDELQLAGAPASAFQRAVVLFQHRRNQEAEAALGEALAARAAAPVAGQAHYYLGVLAERRGDLDAAFSQYEASLAADPSGPLAPDAAWWRAQLLEGFGRLDEAVEAYTQLADSYPQSERAAEALLRAGLVRYRQGRYAAAILDWARYLNTVAEPSQVARGQFWLGRAALAVGDAAAGQDHFRRAVAAAPHDYYGLRAQALLSEEPPLDGGEALPAALPAPNWREVETWLASWTGPEDPEARRGLAARPRWQRGRELALMGLGQEAAAEFAALRNDVAAEPWLLYRLARALAGLGQTASAAQAAAFLVHGRIDAPKALLGLAYPQDFLPLVTAEGQHYGLSPLLLLALIRQESLFDAKAVSRAGALGLTQVIPSTGRAIAEELDVEGFEPADLLRPVVSLRFGSHYLASQLELLEGAPWAALAAYNGGPGNALRWQNQAPDDPDLFLEAIDLRETHAFVRIVLANYALYRFLFGLAERPSLPLS